MGNFETIEVSQNDGIGTVQLNRPGKANALNMLMWEEFRDAMHWADQKHDVRVVVLTGAGKNFCAGIDLMDFSSVLSEKEKCEGRKRENLRRLIISLQECLTAVDQCRKPVIAAVHGACVGAGVDMVACCDMRYVSADAWFQIKEIDIGMTADVGTLQRLPHIINDGLMRELAFTGRKVEADEAVSTGLANRVFAELADLTEGVTVVARQIAAKSPLAIRGTKEMIRYSRDHSVSDSLNYVATWNAGMLLSDDIKEALAARIQNRPPEFSD